MAQVEQNAVFCGLGTFTYVAPIAGPYFVEGKSSIPTLSNGGGVSSLLTVVNVNGSPVYTGVAGAEGFYVVTTLAALDSVTIVFSSAAAVDQGLNVIKSTISLGRGE